MMQIFGLIVLILSLALTGTHAAKRSQMSATEIKECLDKTKDLNTGCDFIQCFHERYNCNDESVTAWAQQLCRQFPSEVIFEFTPPGRQMMINIQNCTQEFFIRIFQNRKKINCQAFEAKYFQNLGKCYAKENNFCQVFKDNRAIFMRQSTTLMLKKPRALQAFAFAAKSCPRTIAH